MTPDEISKLSNEQLNELIAKQRGWVTKHTKRAGTWWEFWKNSTLRRVEEFPPDYCNSWQWAGELLEEMRQKFFRLAVYQWDYSTSTLIVGDYRQGHDENIHNFEHESKVGATRAIAEAFAIMECDK